jgi:hypothetical protein
LATPYSNPSIDTLAVGISVGQRISVSGNLLYPIDRNDAAANRADFFSPAIYARLLCQHVEISAHVA